MMAGMVSSGALKSDVDLRQQVAELRKDQRNLHAAGHILSTYAFMAGNIWLLKTYPNWATYIFTFFFLGFMQYRLVMSTHEATHKTLFFPVWLNEFFGVFHSALVGISFFNYRKTHLEHHKNPQSIEEDIDSYIYRPLLETKPGLRRLSLLVFGVLFDIAEKIGRKIRGARRRDVNLEAPRNPTSLPKQLLPILICQGTLIWFFATYLKWWYYPVFWVVPVLLIALSLDRARTFLEHGYQYIFSNQTWESFKQAPQSTIDVDTNFFERYFFAPFGFAYHQAHHTYLTVPFYNLPRLAGLLEEKDNSYYRRVRGSYVGILTKMIWAKK
jgi:fatty acid desaturase